MAISKSRNSLRTFLLLFLLVVVGCVGWSWYRGRTDQLWERVQTAHTEGRHEAAGIALKSLLRKSPNHAPAHRFLAEVLLSQAIQNNPQATFGNCKPAYHELSIAYKLDPQNRNYAEDLMRAEFENNLFTKAGTIAKDLLAADAANNRARRILAEIALKKNDYKTSEKYLAPISNKQILRSIPLIAVKLIILEHRQNKKEIQFLYERCLKNSLKTDRYLSYKKRTQLNRIVHKAVIEASNARDAQNRLQIALDYFELYKKTGNIGDAALKTVNLVGALHNRFPKHEMFSSDQFENSFGEIDGMISQAIENGDVKSWFYRHAANLMLNFERDKQALAIAHRGLENLSQPKWKNRFDEEISKLHLILATQYVSDGKFRSAQQHLERLLNDARFAAYGHRLAGIVSQHEARYVEAFAHFERARKELKNSLALRLDMAETCMSLKKWNQALSYLKTMHVYRGDLNDEQKAWAEKHLADGFRIHLQEALCYLSLGQFARMENKIEVLRGSRFEPQIDMLQAYALLKQGKPHAAIAALEVSTKQHPKHHRLTWLLVKILDSSNRQADADRIVAEIENQNPQNLSVLSFACLRSLENKRTRNLERQLEILTQKFPEKSVVWYLKYREAMSRNDLPEAAKWSNKLAKHSRTASLGTALSTFLELKNHNLENAAHLLEENFAENASGLVDLLQSEVQFQQGNYDEALDAMTSAMRYRRWRKKSSSAIFRSLSKLLQKTEPNDVLQKIEKLIAQYPRESLLHLTKSDLLLRQGNYAAALATLEKLKQAQPKAILFPILKARIFESIGQFPQAINEINRALEIDRNSIPSRLLAAQICLKTNQLETAREYLTRKNPKSNQPAFQLMIASIEARQGKQDLANDRLLKLIEKNPRSSAAYYLLANSPKKKPKQWEQILRKGLEASPNHWFLRHQLFTLLEQANRQAELQKAIAQFDAKIPAFSTSMRIAGFYFGLEQNANMQKWLEISSKRAKSSREKSRICVFKAEVSMREIRKDRGKLKELLAARQYLEKARKLNPRNRKISERLIALLVENFKDEKLAWGIAKSLRAEFGLNRLSKSTVRFMLNYYLKNEPAKSRNFIEQLIVKRPLESEWIYAMVERAIVEDRIDQALAKVKNIAEKQRWKAEPWLAVARLYEARNDETQAMNALFTAVKLQPKHTPSRIMLIDLCQKARLHRQVVLHTQAVLAKHPTMWPLYDKQLKAFRKLGHKEEANRIAEKLKHKLDEAIRKNHADFQAHRAFVNLNLDQNDLAAALSAVQFARKQLPESNVLLLDEIRILLRLKRETEALSLVKYGFANANRFDCLELARIFLERQMFAMAYDWSKKGYALAKGNARNAFHNLLGEICFHRGMNSGEQKWFEEAAGHYRELLAFNPDNWQAVNNLCWILSDRLNRLADALTLAEDFRRKQALRELDVEFIDTLAIVYRKALAFESNRDFLEEAIRLHPRNAGIRFELAVSYLELGKSAQGMRLLSSAMTLDLDESRQQIARRYLAVPVRTDE